MENERKIYFSKIVRILKITFLVLFVLIFVLISVFFYMFNGGPYTKFAEYHSSDNNNNITVKARGTIFFASHPVKIILKGKGCRTQTIYTYIANDGGTLSEEYNTRVEFVDDNNAVLYLEGAEQDPEIYEIFFDKDNKTIHYNLRESLKN